MAEIQSKPVRRQALQWDGSENGGYGIAAWANTQYRDNGQPVSPEGPVAVYQAATEAAGEKLSQYLTVLTQNGWVTVQPNDWVIIDTQGYPYPCNPVTFDDRWEVVDG